MIVLGLSGATQHDPAACLMMNGKVLAMVEEERLSRVKRGREQMPVRSILYCLAEAGLRLDDVDVIASSWNPALETGPPQFHRFTDHLLVHEAFRYSRQPPVEFVDHHLAHAASAFFASGLEDAAVLVVDGAGENASTSIGFGRGGQVRIDQSIGIRHSLGHFFTFAAEHTGLGSGNEGKLMGLAAYGGEACDIDPIHLDSDGYHVDLPGVTDLPMNELWAPLYNAWRDWFTRRFAPPNIARYDWMPPYGKQRRSIELPSWCADLAAAAQGAVTRAMLHLSEVAVRRYSTRRLVIAGGVGLNCTANGAIRRSGLVDDLFIVPAAHDAGGALGAAMFVSAREGPVEPMPGADLGPGFTDAAIAEVLARAGLRPGKAADVTERAADLLADGRVIGWFQGRAEIGPRALGRRSILAVPNPVQVRDRVNKIKGREPWRPLSPAVLGSDAGTLLVDPRASPFMLVASPVTEEARLHAPAIVHADGTARPQTVTESDGAFFKLIRGVRARTGVAALLNTSFNTEDEPIVCTPSDAVRTFMLSDLDALVIGGLIVEKDR